MSVDPKFVELTADVPEIFVYNIFHGGTHGAASTIEEVLAFMCFLHEGAHNLKSSGCRLCLLLLRIFLITRP